MQMTVLPLDPFAAKLITVEPALTDEQFEQFCALHSDARIERTREGKISMMSPTGGSSGLGNSEISYQLRAWWRTHRRGHVYDVDTGFYLPDGSMMSPDAAYVTQEKVDRYTRRDYKSFPRVCPDFIVELVSETDTLPKTKAKMLRWAENGASLGWLIDPDNRSVLIYTSPTAPVTVVSSTTLEGNGPVAGFQLDLAELWTFFPC